MAPRMAPPSTTKRSSISADESHATALFSADLDVGEGRDGNDVEASLVVVELEETAAGVDGCRDELLDVGRGLHSLEADLARGVLDADVDFHYAPFAWGVRSGYDRSTRARCRFTVGRTHYR